MDCKRILYPLETFVRRQVFGEVQLIPLCQRGEHNHSEYDVWCALRLPGETSLRDVNNRPKALASLL